MVAAGGRITLIPKLAVPNERVRDGVCYLPCHDPEPKTNGWVDISSGFAFKGALSAVSLVMSAAVKGPFAAIATWHNTITGQVVWLCIIEHRRDALMIDNHHPA